VLTLFFVVSGQERSMFKKAFETANIHLIETMNDKLLL
jgi:hypothetical protein